MNKKKLLPNILFFVLIAFLTFLLLEFAFRLILLGRNTFSIEKTNSVHNIGLSGMLQPSEYPEILFELKPNLDTYFKLTSFKTNSHGLRDKEYEVSKPDNSFRVAIIGDSMTLPEGVEIGDAFHSLLEERLNTEERGINYEFINFAVGGYFLNQYWAVIKYKVQEYDPDLVIVAFCPYNDHIIPPDKIFEQPFVAKDKTYPFFRSFVVDQITAFFQVRFTKTDRDDKKGFTTKRIQYMSEIFSEIGSFSKDNNIPILVINLSHRYFPKRSHQVELIAESYGLYFLDVSVPFEGTNPKKYRVYAIDYHPNSKAHAIFAEQIYDYLHEMNLIQ